MASTTLLLAIVAALSALPTHVRTGSTRIGEIVDFGAERSLLFRQLLDTLEHSALVVHVAQGPCPGTRRPACTNLVAGSRGRVLLIHVDGSESMRTVPGLLAHEFQHAIEIAADPEVTDVASLRRLYERIGYPDCRDGQVECWETQAAQSAEREVVRQAVSARPTVAPGVLRRLASGRARLHVQRPSCPALRIAKRVRARFLAVVVDSRDRGGASRRVNRRFVCSSKATYGGSSRFRHGSIDRLSSNVREGRGTGATSHVTRIPTCLCPRTRCCETRRANGVETAVLEGACFDVNTKSDL